MISQDQRDCGLCKRFQYASRTDEVSKYPRQFCIVALSTNLLTAPRTNAYTTRKHLVPILLMLLFPQHIRTAKARWRNATLGIALVLQDCDSSFAVGCPCLDCLHCSSIAGFLFGDVSRR